MRAKNGLTVCITMLLVSSAVATAGSVKRDVNLREGPGANKHLLMESFAHTNVPRRVWMYIVREVIDVL